MDIITTDNEIQNIIREHFENKFFFKKKKAEIMNF